MQKETSERCAYVDKADMMDINVRKQLGTLVNWHLSRA
jgi:hypothetical protein